MTDFLIRAYLAGIGVAIVSGVLGCFIVWRRMSYFGDALAHAAILGVALGLIFDVSVRVGVLTGAVTFALLLFLLQRQKEVASDALLGALAHSALAMGLVLIALVDQGAVDLLALLVGDVLAVNVSDLAWIYVVGAFVLGTIFFFWRRFLMITIDEDLAEIDGISVGSTRALLMCLIATSIAIAVKVVGVLLVASLLIIPAATVRGFSAAPETMAMYSTLVGVLAVVGGLTVSIPSDTPSGPTIVLAAALMFAISQFFRRSQTNQRY